VASSQQFTVDLDDDLAARLTAAARARGWTPESLAADCVAQHLEIAIRHRVLIERLESVDQHLATLAEFIGEATQGGTQVDLGKICRFHHDDCQPNSP
jgi:predicted transcriptional regulator